LIGWFAPFKIPVLSGERAVQRFLENARDTGPKWHSKFLIVGSA